MAAAHGIAGRSAPPITDSASTGSKHMWILGPSAFLARLPSTSAAIRADNNVTIWQEHCIVRVLVALLPQILRDSNLTNELVVIVINSHRAAGSKVLPLVAAA